MQNSGLVTRGISALVYIIVMLTGLYYSPYSLLLLFLFICLIGLWEYQTLVYKYTANKHDRSVEDKTLLCIIGGIIYMLISGVSLDHWDYSQLAWILPLLFVLFITELYGKAKFPFIRLGLNITGLLYIALPCALINVIANFGGEFHPNRLLGILALLSINDTGAYMVGRYFGKTPLFPRISPKKTWEGTIGGAVSVIALAGVLSYLFPNDFSPTTWWFIAPIAIVFGGLGDLVESLLKRSVKVKDSGTIMPGHGGILDRMDAIFFPMPFIYAYLVLYGF